MDIKRLVYVLIGIVLISFGVGIYSLRYNENYKFMRNSSWGSINIGSNGDIVNIGKNGIEVRDGDSHVIVGWDGIDVKDGEDHVVVGWDGIKVNEGDKSVEGSWNFGNWFGFSSKDLKSVKVDEEKNESIDGINSISISSSFVDIKVTSEDRDDINIHYYGSMRTNVVPKLESERKGSELVIKLTTPNNSYSINNSNVQLEVFVPKTYKNDFTVTTSSGDIYMKNLNGEYFYITSSSGDMDLSKINSKEFKLTASSGDIKTLDCVGEYIITTSSGDVNLDLSNNENHTRITTSSGDVDVNLGNNPNFDVSGRTSSGRVNYKSPISINKDKSGKFEFTIGNGGKSIDITTSSGDIEFR